MTRILIVLTSHAALGQTGRKTGFFWEELCVPYAAFRHAGCTVDLASIAGGRPPADPTSVATKAPEVASFLASGAAMAALEATTPITEVHFADYDAVFLPGGHGTMWDLPASEALAELIGRMFDAGRVVGAVCHGPAGLVHARRADGAPIVAGLRVSGFTDAEEAAAGLTDVVPFLLESRLRGLGAVFKAGPDFEPQAVRDGRLVTGQNPASSGLVAELMLEALRDTP